MCSTIELLPMHIGSIDKLTEVAKDFVYVWVCYAYASRLVLIIQYMSDDDDLLYVLT